MLIKLNNGLKLEAINRLRSETLKLALVFQAGTRILYSAKRRDNYTGQISVLLKFENSLKYSWKAKKFYS